MMTQTKKVAVIGSGVGGLATAIRLRVKGHHVDVFEANSYAGGKLSEISTNGYRFDAGPSLFTLPESVDELFRLAGENPGDHFNYIRLDEVCRYFFADGATLTATSDAVELAREFSLKLGEPEKNIEEAIRRSAFLYENLSELFMYRSLQDPETFFNVHALKAYLRVPFLGFFSTMDNSNSRLFNSPNATQFFNRYATYNGSNPFVAPATLNIIPHLEISKGAYFPTGGMISITNSLKDLAERLGVVFYFNCPVDEIVVNKRKVAGVRIGDKKLHFDRVVSNMDMVNTYRKLLPAVKPPQLLLKQPKSSSALIFYWGIKKQFPELGLHNIFFSADYRDEFDHIFSQKSICGDPTVYINISSKLNPTDAPARCENWFTMINVPNNTGQNWDELINQARTNILAKLERALKTDVASLIEAEVILDPRLIETRTSSHLGALYGNSSNNLFAAFLRHGNVSKRVRGLYFVGGSVHPGGGIPLSLASAKILDRYFQ